MNELALFYKANVVDTGSLDTTEREGGKERGREGGRLERNE